MSKKLSRRDFLKLAGVTSAGLALSACGVNATELPTATLIPPTETAIPTLTASPTSTPNFDNLMKVINLQIDKIATAYSLPENQKDILKNCIEKVEVENKAFWIISSSLIDQQDKKLADMIGDTPLALQNDYESWSNPGFKDVTKIHIGGNFEEQENGSDKPMRTNFEFGVFGSQWGATAFQGRNNKNIDDFVTLNADGSATLHASKLDFSWYEDYQSRQALSHLDGEGRRLMLFHLIYPRDWTVPHGYKNLTKQQATDIMVQYIEYTVKRFKNKVFGYSVVNEFGMPDDVMMKIIGKEYIDIAFETVRKADPTALTILNHHENHVPKQIANGLDVTKASRETAQRLKEKGLIDLVGSECHLDFGKYSPHNETIDEMEQTFKSYPVPVMITELDANTTLYKDNPDKFLLQAEKVKNLLQAAINSDCQYINFWGGFPDDKSWYKSTLNLLQADATPWSEKWIEKPMYFETLRTLFKNYAKIGVGS